MKKWMWIVLVIVLIAGGIFYWRSKNTSKQTFKEYTVQKGDIQIAILSTGTVQPENRLEIKAPIAGRIDQVLVPEGAKVRKGQILAWMSSTERAALLDAARSRGPEELKRWEEMYRPTAILASLPGTIILRNVEAGQTITASDAIFAMSDRLTVKALVDETDIAKIKLHQKAELSLDAYPDNKVPAKVDQIAFEAKTTNNVTTYVVDVLPKETPEFMRAGMTANVNFYQDGKDDILLISSEAISMDQGKPSVLVKDARGDMQTRIIETGISDGKKTEVVSGLAENEIVYRAEVNKSEKSASNPFSPFGGGKRPGTGNRGGGNSSSGGRSGK